MEKISITTLTQGVVETLQMLREHFDAENCEIPDPLAGRDPDGLLALALLGAKEIQRRCEGR